ncbi:MAG: hypothetical protein WDM92_04250 [Caulobacteraceae bacterium]
MDAYLAALRVRDSSGLPLADDVRITENGQALTFHEGLWATARGRAEYRHGFADPATQQVGMIGLVDEATGPAVVGLRLMVRGGLITEIETLVARGSEMLFEPETVLKPRPEMLDPIGPGEGSSREEMVSIADLYFQGLAKATGRDLKVHPACNRFENGYLATNNLDREPMFRMGVKAQFDTGFSTIVSEVRDRRFLIVDEEAGLVLASVFFEHDGIEEKAVWADGSEHELHPYYRRPMTYFIFEAFKIRAGEIREIEAVLVTVPFGFRPGWPAPAPAASEGELSGLVDAYLDALGAREPQRLPGADHVRFTENGQLIPLGKGLWGAARGPATYRNTLLDPETGHAGGFFVIGEHGGKVIVGFRLKAEQGRASELETIVVRSSFGALFNTDMTEAPAPFLAAVPASARLSRDEAVQIANLYFDGIQQADGDLIPFHEKIYRIENGLRTTTTDELGEETIYTDELQRLSPAEQINTKFFAYIQRVRNRRFQIYDARRSIVFGLMMFDHPADLEYVDREDGVRVPMPAESLRPTSALISYMFKIEDRKLRQIETAYIIVPYGARSGWDA